MPIAILMVRLVLGRLLIKLFYRSLELFSGGFIVGLKMRVDIAGRQ